jgi:hypothetical protein
LPKLANLGREGCFATSVYIVCYIGKFARGLEFRRLPNHQEHLGVDTVVPTMETRGLSSDRIWDYENGFYWFGHPTRINKLLAHYELYKSIIGLPGDAFEFGVYKAASLIRLATFRNALENDFSRKLVGFDAFGKFPVDRLALSTDLAFVSRFEESGGEGLSHREVSSLLAGKGFQNVHLVEGNILDTLSTYLKTNPATRLAFLHLDMDVREPTTHALELLFDRVVPGGVVVLDDYNTVAGETDAVDEFFGQRGLPVEKSTLNYIPAFVRKPQ